MNDSDIPGGKQGISVESNDTEWAKLVSRAIRGLLVRKGVSVRRLAAELARLGTAESTRSLEGKLHRGTFRLGFFLQVIDALQADRPLHWCESMRCTGDWDARAARLLLSEIEARPWLSWAEVSRRLAYIDENWDSHELAVAVSSGDFAATLFFQCAVVCSFQGVDIFVDQSDLYEAARKGAADVRRRAQGGAESDVT
ncbi:hypothetical protein CR51_22820 [Caballeronia megalochromosomata]|nr:hypothetical protein CR51_22820 [Caballeronia megalochromosomata]